MKVTILATTFSLEKVKSVTIVKRRKLQWYGHVFPSSGLAKTSLQGVVKGEKRTRQTEEEVGRQHQRMNKPAVRQVTEGSEEQKEKTILKNGGNWL